MNILGLHFGHDANMALFKHGKLVAFFEKERHCRIRHAIGLTGSEIISFLTKNNLKLSDIDICTITSTQGIPIIDWENNLDLQNDPRFTSQCTQVYRKSNEELEKDLQSYKSYLPLKLEHKTEGYHFKPFQSRYIHNKYISSYSDIQNKVEFISSSPMLQQQIKFSVNGMAPKTTHLVCHHLAHAQYAYKYSPFDKALIITFDGYSGFDFMGGGIFIGLNGRCQAITPHGFLGGSLFNNLAGLIGMNVMGGAGKLMGLAAYGVPCYLDPQLIGSNLELFHLAPVCTGNQPSPGILTQYWLETNVFKGQLDFPPWDFYSFPPEIYANIASSAQFIFQQNVDALIKSAIALAKRNNFSFDGICLSGGCALNCPANAILFAKYKNIFVPPAVNDEGLSIGSALLFIDQFAKPHVSPQIAYLGYHYDSHEVKKAIAHYEDAIAIIDEDHTSIIKFLAKEILAGKIIAFYSGASEIGPRALGHRSILASPLLPENIIRVNAVKNREPWRPFAPVATVEASKKWFSHVPDDCFFMLFNTRVKTKKLPAITHVDGTARLQVATQDCGNIFQLLQEFGTLSGFEILLNTSFNDKGEPIVETPKDAIHAFLRMKLDYLYLEGYLLQKRHSSPPKHLINIGD